MKSTLKFIFKGVVIGGIGGLLYVGAPLITELVTYTLGHFNSGGVELIIKMNPYLQNAYDALGITDGLHTLADMIPEFETSTTEIASTGDTGAPTTSRDIGLNAKPPEDALEGALNDLGLT